MKDLHDSSFPQQELAGISNILHSSTFGNRFGTVRLGHKIEHYILQPVCWKLIPNAHKILVYGKGLHIHVLYKNKWIWQFDKRKRKMDQNMCWGLITVKCHRSSPLWLLLSSLGKCFQNASLINYTRGLGDCS